MSPAGFIFAFLEESISDFGFSLAVLVVPDSSADDAAHSEENAIAAQAESHAHCVHVVVHTSTHNVLNSLEVLAEKETVEASHEASGWVDESAD